MTVLAFPDTTGQPTDGSFQYTANGVIYSWNGVYWAANNQQGFDQRYVEIAGDVMTGDLTVPSLNGGPLAGFRNQIINGDFRVWQRGPSTVSLTNSTPYVYGPDRWAIQTGSLSAGDSVVAAEYTPSVPDGFVYALEIAKTGTGTGNCFLIQPIELVRNTGGHFKVNSQWTISFWANFDATQSANVRPIIRFSNGVTGGGNESTANIPSISLAESGTGGWNRYSGTFTFTDSTAPADGRNCLRLIFELPGGGASWVKRFTGIQLEPGPVATVFEYRPIGTELSLCQRYYQKIGGTAMPIATGFITTGNTSALHISYKTEMRAIPTISSSGTTNDYALYGEGAPRTITALPFAVLSGTTDAQLQVDGTAFPGVGTTAMLRIAGAAGAVNFDAEL